MYYLNLNVIICIIILLLFLLLIYLYIYKRDNTKIIYILWTLLMGISLYSIYLAYNLIEDIDTIARICHDIDSSKKISNNYDWHDDTIQFLIANLLSRFVISSFLYLLLIFHIQSIIVSDNIEFKFVKYILGERFYSYFIKSLKIASIEENINIRAPPVIHIQLVLLAIFQLFLYIIIYTI